MSLPSLRHMLMNSFPLWASFNNLTKNTSFCLFRFTLSPGEREARSRRSWESRVLLRSICSLARKDSARWSPSTRWRRASRSGERSSAAAVAMVRLMLVPVSPSGTGNTFRSLIFCFCRVMAAAPWRIISLNWIPLIE